MDYWEKRRMRDLYLSIRILIVYYTYNLLRNEGLLTVYFISYDFYIDVFSIFVFNKALVFAQIVFGN